MQNLNIKIGHLDINYYIGGTGEPLVIVHGGGAGGISWLEAANELSKHSSIYLPDLPGYGRSQPLGEKFHLADYVQFLADFCNTVGLKRFCLMGHSIGGAIALEYAMKYPDKVSRLVLVDSLGLSNRVGLWVRMLTSSVLMRSVGKAVIALKKAIRWIAKSVLASVKLVDPLPPVKMDIGRYIANLKRRVDLSERLTELKVPTLLIWGAKDTIVPVSNAYAAFQLIPDCRLRVFEKCRHNVHHRSADKFCEIVEEFLNDEPSLVEQPSEVIPLPDERTWGSHLKQILEPLASAASAVLFALLMKRR